MATFDFLHPAKELYIKAHLAYFSFDLQRWRLCEPNAANGFWVVHLDTLLVSVALAVMFAIGLYLVARNFRQRHPNKIQVAVEMLVEAIDGLVTDIIGVRDDLASAIAFTTFSWIWLLNSCDFLPVDLMPRLLLRDFRMVPTDDPNCTFALAFTIWLFCFYYLIRFKKLRGMFKEFCLEPFGIWLLPFNLAFKLVEQLVRPLSLSLRLYGNMFAGELVFLLIAMLPWWAQWPAGGAWAVFHVLVITIQAFVFMMLSVIYLNMSRQTD